MKQEAANKIRELRHLMEHATQKDRHKVPEMAQWFDSYLASSAPAEAREVRKAVRALWPTGAMVLMEQAFSENPETSAGARLSLEKLAALRYGDKN